MMSQRADVAAPAGFDPATVGFLKIDVLRDDSPRNVAIGITAYNEEANLARLLTSLLDQTADRRIARIVIVSSASTDGTDAIARSFAERDSRISLIAESDRSGKISAINTFLGAIDEPIAVISCADLCFRPDTLERLLAPLDADPKIGMVGGHPTPLNDVSTFVGFAVHTLWQLHDRISRQVPKMGELIAFRTTFDSLDTRVIADEVMIEKTIRAAGFDVAYAEDALVANQGPTTLREFVDQRVRWIAANYEMVVDFHVPVSTMQSWRVLGAAVAYYRSARPKLSWLVALAAIEAYCRLRGYLDYRSPRRHERHRIWKPVRSTKSLGGMERIHADR